MRCVVKAVVLYLLVQEPTPITAMELSTKQVQTCILTSPLVVNRFGLK